MNDSNGRKLGRIGVFVCHCGLNIAASVDSEKVAEEMSHYPGVAYSTHYIYNCSDPGQEIVRHAIREKHLDGVVMANCSPDLHQRTFRNLVASEGLNPYACEVANIREQCSWPHGTVATGKGEIATKKAIAIVKATVERLRMNVPLYSAPVSLNKRALVVGAGIAGIRSALDIANSGYEVVLVEKSPSIGGHVAQLSGTFPTLDSPSCLITPMMAEVASHPKIKIYTYSEIEEVLGYIGNFTIRIRKKATYVDEDRCTHCNACFSACPITTPSEFERGLVERKAIYSPSLQAIPPRPVIDSQICSHFNGNGCRACEEACPTQAIDFSQEDTIVEENVGAVILATGYELISRDVAKEYDEDPDVIDGLAFERLLSQSGPTHGEIRRPSNGEIAKEVVFIECVGSRDPEHGKPYCSRVCCLYTAKQAVLYKRAVPDGQAYVFYIDIRSDVRGTEEFVKRAVDEERVLYLRGRVSRVFRDGDKIKVWGADTLAGKSVEIDADLVVLAMAVIPNPTSQDMARKFNIIFDEHGFFTEAHPKLRPVETLTAGISIAGTAQWPKDIPDTISSASGAASKVLSLFSRKEFLREPTIAYVDEEVCVGCGQCESVCAYHAIELVWSNHYRKTVAHVNEAICEGCGCCAATCPSKALKHRNWTPKQFLEMIDIASKEYA